MKLIYIANIKLTTKRAHGTQIVKMCEAFAEKDFEVELIVSSLPDNKEEIFKYYGVKNNFKVKKVFSINFLRLNFLHKLMFFLEYFSFSLGIFFYALFNINKFKKAQVIYIRDELAPWFMKIFNRNIFIEFHNFKPRYKYFKNFFKKGGSVLITENSKKDFLNVGVPEEKILVAPDGVDIEMFDIETSKEEARKKLDLPLDKKLVIYTGHLYNWKGADTLAEAAKIIEGDFIAVFVGGTKKDIEKFKNKYNGIKNIIIRGYQAYSAMPYYLKAADVLILPNKKGSDLSEKYTSPLKLFEYMAAKRPIIASNLPSIREILNNNNSVLVQPGSSEDLAKKIKGVLGNKESSDKISFQAFNDVQQYSWSERVKRIKEFINFNI